MELVLNSLRIPDEFSILLFIEEFLTLFLDNELLILDEFHIFDQGLLLLEDFLLPLMHIIIGIKAYISEIDVVSLSVVCSEDLRFFDHLSWLTGFGRL